MDIQKSQDSKVRMENAHALTDPGRDSSCPPDWEWRGPKITPHVSSEISVAKLGVPLRGQEAQKGGRAGLKTRDL